MPGGEIAFDLITPDEYVLLGITMLMLISLIHHVAFEASSTADDEAAQTVAVPRRPLVPRSEFRDADAADVEWMQKAPRPPPARRQSEDVLFSASAAAYLEAAQQTGGGAEKGAGILKTFTRTKTRKQERRQHERTHDAAALGLGFIGGRQSTSPQV